MKKVIKKIFKIVIIVFVMWMHYGIKLANVANEFILNEVGPRIFTPAEGEVRFYFENPNFAEVTIKIFDITGLEIRKNLKRGDENFMLWDGRDENNQIVRGGIYIYQIEADGKVINGTIVVAK